VSPAAESTTRSAAAGVVEVTGTVVVVSGAVVVLVPVGGVVGGAVVAVVGAVGVVGGGVVADEPDEPDEQAAASQPKPTRATAEPSLVSRELTGVPPAARAPPSPFASAPFEPT
jgi:hypothetical protein